MKVTVDFIHDLVAAYGGVIRKGGVFDTPIHCSGNNHRTEQDSRCLRGELVWKGGELTEERYIHYLTPEQIRECEKSMQGFKGMHQSSKLAVSGPDFGGFISIKTGLGLHFPGDVSTPHPGDRPTPVEPKVAQHRWGSDCEGPRACTIYLRGIHDPTRRD